MRRISALSLRLLGTASFLALLASLLIAARLQAGDAVPAAAYVNGTYRNLLQVLNCPQDAGSYGSFRDYGYWAGGSWCGQAAKGGYWVWVNPNWYVWGETGPPAASSQATAAASSQGMEILPSKKSDIDSPTPNAARKNPNAYAIVIGIENYRNKLPRADYATNDAGTFAEYLTNVLSLPEENIITLLNEQAAKSDFEKYIESWLPNNVEENGSVYFYYSGHGAPNPKTGDAYLVPFDGDPSFIGQTGYSLARLYESLGKLKTGKVIVTLDSCFSGVGGRSVMAKGARPLVVDMEKSAPPAGNITVLSASSNAQASTTYQEKGHGLFTYFLLKGIKDRGVVKTDGSLEVRTLYNYLKPQVESVARKKYNNEQVPQLIGGK